MNSISWVCSASGSVCIFSQSRLTGLLPLSLVAVSPCPPQFEMPHNSEMLPSDLTSSDFSFSASAPTCLLRQQMSQFTNWRRIFQNSLRTNISNIKWQICCILAQFSEQPQRSPCARRRVAGTNYIWRLSTQRHWGCLSKSSFHRN